jgi:hypothetical protein
LLIGMRYEHCVPVWLGARVLLDTFLLAYKQEMSSTMVRGHSKQQYELVSSADLDGEAEYDVD